MSGQPLKCELTYPERKDNWRPFHVVVHDCALEHLMSDAQQALRVYELMCITRPGDVCKYLWVELLEVPDWVRIKAAEQREKTRFPKGSEWPENFVPLGGFDSYFSWGWEYTPSLDACWLNHRESDTFKAEIRRIFQRVIEVQRRLRVSQDPLVRREVESLELYQDPRDLDPHLLSVGLGQTTCHLLFQNVRRPITKNSVNFSSEVTSSR